MVLISKVPIISCLWKSFPKAPIFTTLYDIFCKYCQQPLSNSSLIDRRYTGRLLLLAAAATSLYIFYNWAWIGKYFHIKTYDFRKTLDEERIPDLLKQIKTLTQQIEEVEQFVKARPALMQLCEHHWQDFSQYAVKPIYISTTKSIDPSNVIDYVYLLQKELLEKERIMGNYSFFVETYPEVKAALMECLSIKNREICHL